MATPFIITEQNITVNYEGQTHTVKRTDPLADQLIAAIKEGRDEDIPDLVSAAKRIVQYDDEFQVRDGQVFIGGFQVPDLLSKKILLFMAEGLPSKPLIAFAANLQKNPSFRAVQELYRFLEKNDQPITEDGCFIGYKRVNEDFTDCHTGKFDNHPGQVLEMPRNQVNDDTGIHCSHGFHVGNWRYCHAFNGGSGHMLEVKVNPADVVSVPNDMDEKVRVCKYEVLGVITQPLDQQLKDTSVSVGNMNSDRCLECGEVDCDGSCIDDSNSDYCECCGEMIGGCNCSCSNCASCGEAVCDCL